MADESVEVCEGCKQILEPGEARVKAVGVMWVAAQGDTAPTPVEGLGVLFHPGCYPTGSKNYRKV